MTMFLSRIVRLGLAGAAGAALGLAAPASAQVDETQAASVPSCSANQTDHCINRGRMGHMDWHHHKMRHHWHHHHWHHHHWHHHHWHHHHRTHHHG